MLSPSRASVEAVDVAQTPFRAKLFSTLAPGSRAVAMKELID
jgi:hypothetical protein